MPSDSGARLTREDWARAGFLAFVEAGLDAVVVEQVARRIGATKGSFYWHFGGRDDLGRMYWSVVRHLHPLVVRRLLARTALPWPVAHDAVVDPA